MNLKKTEALLITSPPNIHYFSTITGEHSLFLLFTHNKNFVCTDSRFIKDAGKIAKGFTPVEIVKKEREWWHLLLKKSKIKTLYFEPSISYYELNKFRKLSRGIARLKPTKIDLQEIREVKTKKEIAYLKKAIHITDEIMTEIVKFCKKNIGTVSEQDIVLEIYKHALLRGCTELAFPPIVAFGKNSGIPHHASSPNRKLKRGDMILIDMGVKYNGYCGDLTRTFFTKAPSSRVREVYNKVLDAQIAAIDMIKPKQPVQDIFQKALDVLGNDAEHFTHGLGHGVGLEIHELPNLKPNSPDILKPNHIVTVEPGLYYNWGGIRIEDIVLVNSKNKQILTKAPKILTRCILHK